MKADDPKNEQSDTQETPPQPPPAEEPIFPADQFITEGLENDLLTPENDLNE
jgi:hypothetical protein